MSHLILYPKTERAFDTNGIGILADALEAEVYEELNGQFELTVQYPVNGIHYGEIVTGAYITAHSSSVSGPQPFRVYRVTKPMRGKVTVYAHHIAYKNRKITVAPFVASSAPEALQSLKTNAVNDCPFTFWTDKTTEGEMVVQVPTAIWTLLGSSEGSILDVYGGEYEFDGFTVKLHTRRGADRGVIIRYGKNLTDFQQDESAENVYTGVYPYWRNSDGLLVTLPEKVVYAEGNFAEHQILPLDLSGEFQEQPTEAQLRERTEKYVADNDIAKQNVSWSVSWVPLENTVEYKHMELMERVLLGDTVGVMIPHQGVTVSARAVAARYLPLQDRYKEITLGRVKANLAATIAQQGRDIKKQSDQLSRGMPELTVGRINGKAVSWKENGDGTFSLVGTK